MPFFIASAILQIACIVHVLRTGRNQMWIMPLFFFPVIGCIVYAIVEVLPGAQANRHVRRARSKVVDLVDPERRLRMANEALTIVDSAANRSALGDAFADLDRHAEALPHFRAARGKVSGSDPALQIKIARSLFETGAGAEALRTLDEIGDRPSVGEADRRKLLRARILELLGRNSDAEDIYADIVARLPGNEARCRYAALLLGRGATMLARQVLEDVEVRMKLLDRSQRAEEAGMYDWAMTELARLRG